MVQSKFKMDDRMKSLWKRSTDLSKEGKRNVYVDNPEFLVYHWSGHSAGFSPATGEMALAEDQRINLGDHNCRVDNGQAFPYADDMPSKKEGFDYTAENWAKDYVFFLDHSPAEVYPNETIVGEFHWQLDEARKFVYPDEVVELGFDLRQKGAGGTSLAHTCPDLSIGLKKGWTGLLKDVQESKAKWEKYGNRDRVSYLSAQEDIINAIIRYINRHSDRALELAKDEKDEDQYNRYIKISENMKQLAAGASNRT